MATPGLSGECCGQASPGRGLVSHPPASWHCISKGPNVAHHSRAKGQPGDQLMGGLGSAPPIAPTTPRVGTGPGAV